MKKKVLVLNISHNELRVIHALREMDFYIIGTGGQSGLVGQKYVDEYIQEDYSNKESILSLAKILKIDAICACCNDFGVITAAYVAEQLGLQGHDTYENALILHHKDRFKKFAEKYGFKTPLAQYFSSETEALAEINKLDYPVIVKPVDLTGGKGVSMVSSVVEATIAINQAFSCSKEKRIVIELFIEGTQHACCTFLINKKVVAYCTNNEYSFINPYKVEIDTYPADNFEKYKTVLLEEIERMAKVLDLSDGILSMQYIEKNGEIYIIEAMRRVLGNLYMIPAQKLTNINWDYWEAKSRCGLDCSDFPKFEEQKGFYAYKTIMATRNGNVKEIVIPDTIKGYIFDQYMLWTSGTPIQNYMQEQLGFLFFEFSDKTERDFIMLDRYDDISVTFQK